MKQTEVAWCAGFFDGEGCVAKNHNTHYLKLTQKNPEALNRFRKTFNGGKIIRKEIPHLNSYIHNYYLFGLEAIIALSIMLPYLTVKQDQAMKAIENRCNVRCKARSMGFKSPHTQKGERIPLDVNRLSEIIKLHDAGHTFNTIGKILGITRQRTHQLYLLAKMRTKLVVSPTLQR